MLLHQTLELNCLRKFGSMKAVDLCGLFKVSFYQEISMFAQQKSGEREWKENMKELQITLTLKPQVKNYYDVLKALPPTSISISSLTFKPIKHMSTEGKMGKAHWILIYYQHWQLQTLQRSSRHTAPQLLPLPWHQNTCGSDIVSKFFSHFPRKLLRLVSERGLTTHSLLAAHGPCMIQWCGCANAVVKVSSLPVFNVSSSSPCCLYLG